MQTKDFLDRVSIKDVARAAGTSVSTVSRALNDHPDVSTETRDKILQVARTLGYERNPFAQSLVSGRSGLIAIIVHDIDNDYHLQLLRGFSRAARAYDLELLFSFTASRQETLGSCLSVYRRGVADGAVVFSPMLEEQPQLLELQNAGFPLVVIHPVSSLEGLTSIEPEDFEGAVTATRHLITLGHRRIACAVESETWGAGPGRLGGYKVALAEAGIAIDPALIITGLSGFPEWGHAVAQQWLEAGVTYTAVLCFNDLVAYGLIQELNARGIAVPEQVSVIGFDDVPNSRYICPSGLTTMRQPIADIGQQALEMLVKLIDGDMEAGEHVRIPMELILRGTTAPPNLGAV